MEQERADLERRRFLQLAAGGVLGVGTIGSPASGAAAATRFPRGDPVTMAMHLHGSFSEGTASMDAHLHQARRLGVDVLWWTDHDFRVGAFGYRQAIGFDGEEELENGSAWTWNTRKIGALASAEHTFVTTPLSPDERVGRALRLTATGSADRSEGSYQLEGRAWNSTYSTSYADTVLELDVLPEQITADAQIVVEIGSSYRPATAGRAAGQYRLQYRVGGKSGHWTEDKGRLGVIGITAGPSTSWQRLTLHLRADHAALWPDTVAADASLKQFRVGVLVRGGATAGCVVDRLRFLRSRRSAADGMKLLKAAISEYRGRYPGIVQHAASEVSLVKHLNAFGGDGTLPTYAGTKASKDGSLSAQRQMVRFLQSHGACVSINHPHPGRHLSDALVRTHGLGADVIEIGTHRRVESLARSFDVAARNAIFITASGVTDDHAGNDWLQQAGPRWITGAWARSRHQDDLAVAMRAGRAWFYDPLWWSGALDMLVDGYVPMGGVLFTSQRSAALTIKATQLPTGSSLELVIGQCDRAGRGNLRPANRSIVVPARKVVRGRWSTDINHRGGVYVRVMVRRHDGTVVGFSNPVWLLPQHLSGTVRVPRERHYRRA
jgi:hypothetical protein